jgi:hypothetical protein
MPDHRAKKKMSTFHGCKFFALFDLERMDNLQGALDSLGQQIFAIVTEDRVFCPLRVPYMGGFKNAPVWFHNAIARLVKRIACCESTFDDACLGAESFDSFAVRLECFFFSPRVINNHNLKLKAKKVIIGVPQVRFCWTHCQRRQSGD